MQDDNDSSNIYKLSWLAYFKPLVMGIVVGLAGLVVSGMVQQTWLSWVALLAGVVSFIYQLIYVRTTTLYTDEAGVWLYEGVFPWQKGVRGVKWRDLDSALFFTGFISWAFKSYAINIGHRYTKGSEIHVRHVKNGKQFVELVNAEHYRQVGGESPSINVMD
ncbi:hypothetical protein B0H98_108109 [Vreelandella songnenensis]|uniref:Uncharacterized protein n=1 Tax=Vreelandella songnenensis TaxID=1176243 RepID=A0A2T0V037_9GAMM|nr:hypothetical protein [Halomonas songnenensis]PRY63514.1 hypothetical protein B0H98_108109 [Halomonas songnenensis]